MQHAACVLAWDGGGEDGEGGRGWWFAMPSCSAMQSCPTQAGANNAYPTPVCCNEALDIL
eukprot:38864-Chlamydomonas_euryale.AAC.1